MICFMRHNLCVTAATMLKKGEDPITGVNRDPMTRFVTTNQRTYTSHQGPPVGYSNQGPPHLHVDVVLR